MSKLVCNNCNKEFKTVVTMTRGVMEREYDVENGVLSFIEEIDFHGEEHVGFYCPSCDVILNDELQEKLDDMW